MLNLLSNAWLGWQSFMDNGKFAALLILVLLFFWFCRFDFDKKEADENEFNREKSNLQLMIYTTLMVVCCIFPVTAAVLMKYQTAFYDYEWIWSCVPLTIVVALGGVVFLWKQWECYDKEQKSSAKLKKLKKFGISAMVIVLVILSGRLGNPEFDAGTEAARRENAKSVLTALAETVETEEICLWAPKDIMASARAQQPRMRLIYGRNMWDGALGAYFYEGYGKTEESLYLWMNNAEFLGTLEYTADDGQIINGIQCVETAKAAGVNVILLPGNMQEEAVLAIENHMDSTAQMLEGYYMFTL